MIGRSRAVGGAARIAASTRATSLRPFRLAALAQPPHPPMRPFGMTRPPTHTHSHTHTRTRTHARSRSHAHARSGLYIFFSYMLRWLPLLIYGACDNINMPRLGLGIFGSIFFAIGPKPRCSARAPFERARARVNPSAGTILVFVDTAKADEQRNASIAAAEGSKRTRSRPSTRRTRTHTPRAQASLPSTPLSLPPRCWRRAFPRMLRRLRVPPRSTTNY